MAEFGYEPVKLSKAYTSIEGTPTIDSVDLNIFRLSYFSACLSCTFCGHSCCNWGVDIDVTNVERIRARKDELEAYLGTKWDDWFTGEWEDTPDYPGGTAEERSNRDKLRRLMESEGFKVNSEEWWHFDHKDWSEYAIYNIPFTEIGKRTGK